MKIYFFRLHVEFVVYLKKETKKIRKSGKWGHILCKDIIYSPN
jgi:hypothetical protein